MNIIQSILTKNPCYKAGRKITVEGLMLHSVGCSQPSAMVFVNSWNPPANGRKVCVHAFIDGNTGDVYQTLPWNHRGWHGGGSSNNTHIGVEMCEPACLRYSGGSGKFTCTDIKTAKAVVQRTYDTAVQLFAHLCKQFDLDPLADGVIVSHKEGHDRGIACDHGDPEHLWNQLKMGYTMDGFRKAVKTAMNSTRKDEDVMYYVQVPFDKKADAETVKNAFKLMGVACTIVNDDVVEPKPTATKKSVDEVAKEVLQGKWGNGDERKKKLIAAGYDYSAVQKKVNELCK